MSPLPSGHISPISNKILKNLTTITAKETTNNKQIYQYKHIDHSNITKTKSSSDVFNILFLFFLYLLQGIPLGLAASLPLILSSRNVSYADQAWFRFAILTLTMK